VSSKKKARYVRNLLQFSSSPNFEDKPFKKGKAPKGHRITMRSALPEVTFHRLRNGEPRAMPQILFCPMCHVRHIDRGIWTLKLHHTHACQSCGFVWRPAIEPTVGVQFLPGFKDHQSEDYHV
jgi:hypothetical protein